MLKRATRLAAALVFIFATASAGSLSAADLSYSPELYADSILTSMSIQRQFAQTIPSLSNYSQTAHKQIHTDSNCITTNRNWVMWDTPWLDFDTRETDNGHFGYDVRSAGFATGITKLFGPNASLGLAVGYDGRKQTGRDYGVGMHERAEAFHSALYGGASYGCLFFDAYAGYSYARHRAQREGIDVATGANFDTGSNYSDDILSGGLKISYVIGLPASIRMIPSIGFDYSHVRQRGFNEYLKEDALIDTTLAVDGTSYNNAQLPIKVAFNRTFRLPILTFGGICSLWTPEVRGGWVPQFGDKEPGVTGWNNGTAYYAEANGLNDSYGTVGGGLKIQLRDKYIFAVDYDYSFASKYDRHALTATYGCSF